MSLVDLPHERREFLTDYAEDIWERYSGECPVVVEQIVSCLRLGPSYDDFGTAFDGILEHRSGRFHIFCNIAGGLYPNHPRVRFTLGHELGHYFIDEHRNALLAGLPPHPSFIDNPQDNPAEDEANAFAAGLLMPRREFLKAMQQAPTGLKGILELGSTFTVSTQSTALRYVALCGKPCAVVMFRDARKPWWDTSPAMNALGLTRISRNRVLHDSATGIASRDSKNKHNDPHSGTTLASAWFAGIHQGGKNDFLLNESAIRLGNFGVLTLLEIR